MSAPVTPITGMACRFPGGCNSPQAYWDFLMAGKSAMRDIPRDRWDHRRYGASSSSEPGRTRVRRGGFIDAPTGAFDNAFFGISGPEAEVLDPQLQLLLEVTYEALEDAGLCADDLRGSSTGVFVGTLGIDHEINAMNTEQFLQYTAHTAVGMTASMRANRVSHAFDFRGPSMAIETACSSTLIALHLARQALLNGECERAIVGGANLMLGPAFFLALSKGNFLSDDGECFTFDARANGYARGEGAAAIVLEAAPDSRKAIHGFLRASAVNHNGGHDGISVPSVEAQSALTRTLLSEAAIEPACVSYVEAHGTGTAVGDVIEAEALGSCLGAVDGRTAALPVGAVKGNIGHLEAVAGLAGLIKTLLVLRHGQVPRNRNFQLGNPNIDFARLKLEVGHSACKLRPDDERIALVSAYGFGGANAQCLVSQGRPARPQEWNVGVEREMAFVPLSAAHPEALKTVAKDVRGAIDETTYTDLTAALSHYRAGKAFRAAIMGNDGQEGKTALEALEDGRSHPAVIEDVARERRLVLLYSGMGTQYFGVGRDLLSSSPVFREAMEVCDDILRKHSDVGLLSVMEAASDEDITDPVVAQPLCVALQIGLTRWWLSQGLRPDAIIGHSSGEMTAAWAAGLFSMEDALIYAAGRGRVFANLSDRGGMTAVAMRSEEVNAFLKELGAPVDVATENGVELAVISGLYDGLAAVEAKLNDDGVWFRRLPVGVPYHSRALQAYEDEFRNILPAKRSPTLSLPIFSTTRGGAVHSDELDEDYWWANVRKKVRFGEAVRHAMNSGYSAFLELGGHPALIQHLSGWAPNKDELRAVSSLNRKLNDADALNHAAATLYTAGAPLDLGTFYSRADASVLPPYPWRCREEGEEKDYEASSDDFLLQKPLKTAGRAFCVDLSGEYFPALKDHIVGGAPSVPGVFLIELACAMARKAGRKEAFKKITFWEAITLDTPSELEVRETAEGVEFWSRYPSKGAHWTRCASAHFDMAVPQKQTQIHIDQFKERCDQVISGAVLYDRLKGLGLRYGPSFQAVQHVHVGDNEALAILKTGHEKTALFDAALQSLAALAPCDGMMRLAPTFIERFLQVDNIEGAYAALVRKSYDGSSGLIGEVIICDSNGAMLASFSGVELRARGAITSHDVRFLDTEYIPYTLKTGPGSQPLRRWRIMPDASPDGAGAAEAIAAVWQEQGEEVTIAARTNNINLPKVDLFNPASVTECICEAVAEGADAMALLWACAPPASPSAGPNDDKIGLTVLAGVMHAVQSLVRHGEGRIKRLLVLTKCGALSDEEALMGASLSGFLRVAANEHPEFKIIHIETDDLYHPEFLEAIANLPYGPDCHYRFKEGAFSTPRVIEPEHAPTPAAPIEVGDDYGFCPLRSQRMALRHITQSVEVHINADDIEIKVDAFTLSPEGSSSLQGRSLPLAPGDAKEGMSYFAGRLVRTGAAISNLRRDDSVIICTDQPFASRMRLSAHDAFLLPTGWTVQQGLHLKHYLAAFYALRNCARIEPGDRVLAPSVNTLNEVAAVCIARHFGAQVWSYAYDADDHARLAALGVKAIAVQDDNNAPVTNLASTVFTEEEGGLYDIVIGSVDGAGDFASLDFLAAGGKYISLDDKSQVTDSHLHAPNFRNRSFVSVDLNALRHERPEAFRSVFKELLEEIEGSIDLPPMDPQEVIPVTQESLDRAADVLSLNTRSDASPLERIDIDDIVFSTQHSPEYALQAPLTPAVREDATYLVTGGTSGLGLEIAEALSTQGAGQIILVSRSGNLGQEAEEKLNSLTADIDIRAADLTCEESVRALLKELSCLPRPLRGIVHAANIYDDEVIYKFDRARLRSAVQPKLLGGWFLHHHSMGLPLDFFVLMGSTTMHLGSPGQAAYVAANEGLAALSRLRRAKAMPAQIFHWGLVADAGIGARDANIVSSLDARGVYPLSLHTFREQLIWHLRNRTPEIAVGAFDWKKWVTSLGAGGASGLYHELLPELDAERHALSEQSRGMLSGLAPEDRLGRVTDMLRTITADLLGVEPVSIDLIRPLGTYGMDSLLAVQFLDRVQLATGLEPGPPNIFAGSSLVELATAMLAQLSQPPT